MRWVRRLACVAAKPTDASFVAQASPTAKPRCSSTRPLPLTTPLIPSTLSPAPLTSPPAHTTTSSSLLLLSLAPSSPASPRRVCLTQHYTKASCPLYLTREGFELLKANDGEAMNSFRLHTDRIDNVMKQLGKESLTVAVLMDLQDCAFSLSASFDHADFLGRVPQLARPL